MSTSLVADIGGTHARFALLTGSRMLNMHSLDVAAYATPEAAIAEFLKRRRHAKIDRAVIAAAGPVSGNRCKLTNGTWVLDGEDLAAKFGFASVHVVNDLEALGWAVLHLRPKDYRAIGGGRCVRDGAGASRCGETNVQ